MLRKEIELGKQAHNMYNLSQEQANHTLVIPLQLLHQRFGHLSISILRQFNGFSHVFNSFFHDCLICFQLKQSQTIFPLSNIHASTLFDLVHCDIWGLININPLVVLPISLL